MRISSYEVDENSANQPWSPKVCLYGRAQGKSAPGVSRQSSRLFWIPVLYPVVSEGQERVRFIFQAQRTDEVVERFADCICAWAEEMLEIGKRNDVSRFPTATHQAFAQVEAEKKAQP